MRRRSEEECAPCDDLDGSRLRRYVEAAGGVSQEMCELAARSAKLSVQCHAQLPDDCRTLLDYRCIVEARYGRFSRALAGYARKAASLERFEKVCAVMAEALDASTGFGDWTVMSSDCLCRGFEMLAQNPFLDNGALVAVREADAKRMIGAYLNCVAAFQRLNSTLGGCFSPGGVSVFSSDVRQRLLGLEGGALVRRILFDDEDGAVVFTPLCLRELASGLAYMNLENYPEDFLASRPLCRDEERLYDFNLFMMVISRRAATSNTLQFRRCFEQALAEMSAGDGRWRKKVEVKGDVVKRPRAVLADRRISDRLAVVSGMIRWRSDDGRVHVAKCSAKPTVEILNALFSGRRGGVRLTAGEIAQLKRNVRSVAGGDFAGEVLARVRDEEPLKGGPYYRVTIHRAFT